MQDALSSLQVLLVWALACSPCLAILLAVLLQKEEKSICEERPAETERAGLKRTLPPRARRSLSLLAFRHTG